MSSSSSPPTLHIEARDPAREEEAGKLARELGVPLAGGCSVPKGSLHIVLQHDSIELWSHDSTHQGARIDFSNIDIRPGTSNLSRKQPLARAIGRPGSSVIDATAGFGHDSFLLACMGYEVIAIERVRLIYLLLSDALRRARAEPGIQAAINGRFQLEYGDAISTIPTRSGSPDVIYLDPMFAPERPGSALPKKRAQLLRMLVGTDDDAVELVDVARASAQRVVVKRADSDPPLVPGPSHAVRGKIVRYDVYLQGA